MKNEYGLSGNDEWISPGINDDPIDSIKRAVEVLKNERNYYQENFMQRLKHLIAVEQSIKEK